MTPPCSSRLFLGLVALACLGGCAVAPREAAAPARPASRRPPNIIFILADDLGYGDLGAFYQNARAAAGNHAAHLTPQLDRLGADGVRLTHHYCAAPVCAPSRASFLLGVTQGHANVRDNQFDKALEDNHTVGSVLRAAGYATAVIGKWGLQGEDDGGWGTPRERGTGGGSPAVWRGYPTKRGFDYFYGYVRHSDGHYHYPKEDGTEVWENDREVSAGLAGCYTTDLFTARAKRWIADRTAARPDQPFFLFLSYDTPHAKLQLPPGPYPAGGGLHGGLQWTGQPGHMINSADGKPDSWMHPDYAAATYDADGNPATPEAPWPDVNRRYAASIRRIDDAVADLRQLLADLKIGRDTLIVFSSDNGPSEESYLPEKITPEFFRSFGPFDGIKRDMLEGGLRVPTMACWPGHVPAGGVITTPSAQWDWLATFADLAGVPAPARADGVSLWPGLSGRGKAAARPGLYFEFLNRGRTPDYAAFEPRRRGAQRGQMQVVRAGSHLGVRYNLADAGTPFEIYDVVADPKQRHDLAATPAGAALDRQFRAIALQSRRPDAEAPRPYDGALVPADAAAGRGVRWQRFAGAFPWVPDFSALTPAASGTASALLLAAAGPLGQEGGVLFSGSITAPADGEYTFHLRADTGALLRLHAATLIDADYGYPGGAERSATVPLARGAHPFRLYYRHAGGAAPQLTLEWSGPGIARQPVPPSAFAP